LLPLSRSSRVKVALSIALLGIFARQALAGPMLAKTREEKRSESVAGSYIINGDLLGRNAAPYLVRIDSMIDDTNRQHCGGTILHDGSWILTAAHCFGPTWSENPQSVKVTAGEHTIGRYDGTEKTIYPLKVFVHSGYKGGLYGGNEQDRDNDIALVYLGKGKYNRFKIGQDHIDVLPYNDNLH